MSPAATRLTTFVLGPRVWGDPALEVSGYDHTGTTMVPITTNNTGQAWYLEQDQATAAADSSVDLLTVFANQFPGLNCQVLLAARAPDGETITVDLYRDGSLVTTMATFSNTEWQILDLGQFQIDEIDYFAGIPWTLRLHGGLWRGSFMQWVPRPIPYAAKDDPGVDATGTVAVSYSFNGDVLWHDAPWPAGDLVFWGPVTPTGFAPVGETDYVQPVGLFKADPSYGAGGGSINANWIGYLGQHAALYCYIDGEETSIEITPSLTSRSFMEQFTPVAWGDLMGNTGLITGLGARQVSTVWSFTEGMDISFVRVDQLGKDKGNDAPLYLDQIYLARPAYPPFMSASDACDEVVPYGTVIDVTFGHTDAGLIIDYGLLVLDTSTWATAIPEASVTSPATVDTAVLTEGVIYRILIRSYFIDGSWTWDYCDFTVGAAVYGPASLAATVSM